MSFIRIYTIYTSICDIPIIFVTVIIIADWYLVIDRFDCCSAMAIEMFASNAIIIFGNTQKPMAWHNDGKEGNRTNNCCYCMSFICIPTAHTVYETQKEEPILVYSCIRT